MNVHFCNETPISKRWNSWRQYLRKSKLIEYMWVACKTKCLFHCYVCVSIGDCNRWISHQKPLCNLCNTEVLAPHEVRMWLQLCLNNFSCTSSWMISFPFQKKRNLFLFNVLFSSNSTVWWHAFTLTQQFVTALS